MPHSKKSKSANSSNPNKLPALSIPRVCITSEDALTSTPPVQDKELALYLLQRGQHGYRRDEDSASDCPLLDSGNATPLNEEPTIPLNMGTFLASSQKLKAEISSEEICLSSLDGDRDIETTNHGFENPLDNIQGDYPFVKWQWKYIRIFSSLVTLLAILSCFGSSFTFIAHLPQRCDPLTEWWQGKLFYTLDPFYFHDSDGDGVGDIAGIASKLDYLQMDLHVHSIRLGPNIFQEANTTLIDPRLGDVTQFIDLIAQLENRNMTLILDLPVKGSGYHHLDNIIKFWLHQGVHGFYLTELNLHPEAWKNIAKWKTSMDSFSSGFIKKRIFIVSSDFVRDYAQHHPLVIDHVLKQFDLVEQYLDVSRPNEMGEQIRQGLIWDSSIDKPWIMWTVGGFDKPRLANVLECLPPIGALMLSMGLPGSSSIYYGDEISLDEAPFNNGPNFPFHNSSMNEDVECKNINWVQTLGMFSDIRQDAVPLHVNVVLKFEHDILKSRTFNYLCKVLDNDTVVVERFYPRRHRYLLIANLGSKNVSHDLSNTWYGGKTLVSSTGNKMGYVELNQLHLLPGEGLLLLLDK